MLKKNTLLLVAVSAFALTMATSTNAAYQCVWSDGVKLCGNQLGFAPTVGGESDRRDQFSGDRDRDDSGRSRGSDGPGASDGQEGRGDTSPE